MASSSAASGTPEPTQTPCPNPEGQACLGRLAAGTYTTRVFHPAVTYTVPAGWKNYEDTPGNFVLVPPRGDLPGVNAGLRLARGWSKTCVYSDGLPVQPLITGLGVSFFDHNVLPGQVTRLHLLDYLQGALGIEVVDIKDAHHLPEYSRLVQKLHFRS